MKQSNDIPRERARQNQLATQETSQYYSNLLSLIDTTQYNPANVRNLIYEFARLNLEKNLSERHPAARLSEKKAGMRALEIAIARVETNYAPDERVDRRYQHEGRRLDPVLVIEPDPVAHRPASTYAVRPQHFAHFKAADEARMVPAELGDTIIAQASVAQVSSRARRDDGKPKDGTWFWFVLWPMLQFASAPILTVALMSLTHARVDPQISQSLLSVEQLSRSMFSRLAPANDKSQVARSFDQPTTEPAPALATQVPGVPIPNTYGVYAVSRGKLHELEQLPIKMPDARVFLSAEISKPSRTDLPDGKVAFVVFRRDLVNSAPEKATVRVIARVTREMTFKSGKAIINPLEGQWRIRNNLYEFKVAPIGNSREMILIRPDNADFSLPPGRYALVVNNFGYDFSVEGPIAKAEQCLERIDAANGTVYSECRKP